MEWRGRGVGRGRGARRGRAVGNLWVSDPDELPVGQRSNNGVWREGARSRGAVPLDDLRRSAAKATELQKDMRGEHEADNAIDMDDLASSNPDGLPVGQRSSNGVGRGADRFCRTVQQQEVRSGPGKKTKLQKDRRGEHEADNCIDMDDLATTNPDDKPDYDDSSSEEELDVKGVLNKMVGASGLSPAEDGLGRTTKFLMDGVTSRATICLICISSVRRIEQVWNCKECYVTLHLLCIKRWATDSMYHQMTLNEQEPAAFKNVQWSCPKCRHNYGKGSAPAKYWCYCGQVSDPVTDPWIIPHSCGQVCSRFLQPACGHICMILCHPGPCPPCPKTVPRSCLCGKDTPTIERCSASLRCCGRPCGKVLKCGHHTCIETCHGGDCPPCPKQSSQPCQCQQDVKKRPCADPVWKCGRVCDKYLCCGYHTCEVVCHSGDCGECSLNLPRSCPCGKTKQTLPCIEKVKPCGDTCGKNLSCGLHKCMERCHYGPCGQCLQVGERRCRCGTHKKSVSCLKEYLCESKCKKMRDCGRHPCNKRCCAGECPPCEQECRRSLRCKNHKCTARCHPGQCFPCDSMVDMKCRCGATKVTVPCGREKKMRPPACELNCRVPPTCHHEKREAHKCHFGPCPPCRQACGKVLHCDHTCPKPCHSQVKVKFSENRKLEGPWDRLHTYYEIKNLPCPPCLVKVPVTCFGKHETVDTPCCECRPTSCSQPCGRMLACGSHKCEKPCHIPSESLDYEDKFDAAGSVLAGPNCEYCEKQCTKRKKNTCQHGCPSKCHLGPCPPCKRYIRIRCYCGVHELHKPCSEMTNSDGTENLQARVCGGTCMKERSCGHNCKLTCHSGSCDEPSNKCKFNTTLFCACKRTKKTVLCWEQDAKEPKCNKVCEKFQAEEEQRKREIAEKLQQEAVEKEKAELEEFMRKMSRAGRKKPKKASFEEENNNSRWSKVALYAGIMLTLVALAIAVHIAWK